MRKQLQIILSATFFLLLLIYAAALFHQGMALFGQRSEPGWETLQIDEHILVHQATSPEAMAVLRRFDEVVAINGTLIDSGAKLSELFSQIEPGSFYTLTVVRNGQRGDVRLPAKAIPYSAWIISGALRFIIPNIFLLTGLIVFLLKPYDKQGLLLGLMFGMFTGAILSGAPTFAGHSQWLILVTLVVNLVSLFLWPVFFHFFQIFPEPSALVRKWPKLEAYLYIPHLLTIFPYSAIANVLAAFAPARYLEFIRDYPFFGKITLVIITLYLAGGLLSLLLNYRSAGRTSRRKMRVVVAGSIAGFLPFFLAIGMAIVFNLSRVQMQWPVIIATFCFPLFPLSFAYAIVRHQVIPVRLMVRRGVRYVLVSRGFIIVQALVVFAILSYLLTGSRLAYIDSFGERADIVATMAATALAIGALTIVNQRVLPIIDRRFFREAYDPQQILSDLGLEMRRVTNVRQLLDLAITKIQDALHIENVTVFLRDRASGDYTCRVSSNLSTDGTSTTDSRSDLRLPANGYATARLQRSSLPLAVYLDREWGQGVPAEDVEARQRERAALRRLRTELLLPVATKDELLGVMSLGPRLGDLPYSFEDKQLLTAIAFQVAFAIQNAELVQQVAAEERLRHELEIATAVQRRLFPESPPDMDSLELAGVCHPARGVGGDYYDFIPLEDNKLGIAVADVAGKGISAALLMSTVQASLRSQAPNVNGNLTELVASMNRLLHTSTDAASYATFFYAQFDEKTGLLTYVNAGHNPPLLVRATSSAKARSVGQAVAARLEAATVGAEPASGLADVCKLTKGGPIIGAFHECQYEQESIAMRSGDLLIAYTDGVTEAFNPDDDEFGEDRLHNLVEECVHLSVQEITERIVNAVRDWAQDTPQNDDLTLVVMKVK